MTTHELILNFIKKYFLEHCYAPSYEEIVASTGISKATLHGHMKRFFLDGELVNDFSNDFGKARAYRPKGFACIDTSEESDESNENERSN